MKGAMAVPCVRISSPPNRNMTIMIGNSQNFLRTRANRHNSDSIDISFPLELFLHGFRRRTRRLATYPVTRRVSIELQVKQVLAAQPQEHGDRREDHEKNKPHHDRIDDFGKQ